MPKIHCLNNISAYGTDQLPENYQLTDQVDEAQGILVRSAAMHDMEFSEGLLAVARAGAGVNNIPLDRCANEGIVVFNTPGANANAVKELVIAGMLLASRGIVAGMRWCRHNAEDPDIAKSVEKAKKEFAGKEILGKRLGVIGLGAIGAKVANAAISLGMDVYGYDPYVSVAAAWNLDPAVHHITNVNDIYCNCDYITAHVPAVEGTIGMINADACAHMKDGAVVLNFSRDTLVDEPAMTAALASGKVGRYVTDFATPGVMAMENALVIPHLGASTEEAEDNCALMAVREIVDYIDNGNITNSVNFPACNLGAAAGNGSRVAVLHASTPNIAGQITGALGAGGAAIAKLESAARGDFAYTLADLSVPATDAVAAALSAIEGVTKVRIL